MSPTSDISSHQVEGRPLDLCNACAAGFRDFVVELWRPVSSSCALQYSLSTFLDAVDQGCFICRRIFWDLGDNGQELLRKIARSLPLVKRLPTTKLPLTEFWVYTANDSPSQLRAFSALSYDYFNHLEWEWDPIILPELATTLTLFKRYTRGGMEESYRLMPMHQDLESVGRCFLSQIIYFANDFNLIL
jgi:hypothetical protein